MDTRGHKGIIRYLAYLLALSVPLHAGHAPETIIKTNNGWTTQRDVTAGDRTIGISYFNDSQRSELAEFAITQVHLDVLHEYCVVDVGEEVFITSADQMFFDCVSMEFVEAQHLTDQHSLVDIYGQIISIVTVQKFHDKCDMYDLTIDDPHVYFIGASQILVHNSPGVVEFEVVGKVSKEVVVAAVFVAGAACSLVWDWVTGGKPQRHHEFKSPVRVPIKEPARPPERNPLAGIRKNKLYGVDKPRPGFDPSKVIKLPEPEQKPPRKVNNVAKGAFFKSVKDKYENYKEGAVKIKKGAEPIGDKNAHYLKWDHLHDDVEVYNKAKNHIGSLDPATLEMYKDAVKRRKL